jgi:hypothetical protein
MNQCVSIYIAVIFYTLGMEYLSHTRPTATYVTQPAPHLTNRFFSPDGFLFSHHHNLFMWAKSEIVASWADIGSFASACSRTAAAAVGTGSPLTPRQPGLTFELHLAPRKRPPAPLDGFSTGLLLAPPASLSWSSSAAFHLS